MAASANPSGAQDGSCSTAAAGGGGGGGNPNNSSAAAGPGDGLKINPGLSAEWSNEEQTILEEGLSKHASDSKVMKYAKISLQLPGKTVRDVALRCRWMSESRLLLEYAREKESGKRRKEDNLSKKSKEKKERVTDSAAKPPAHLAARPGVAPYTLPMLPMENDDEISLKAIGGQTGQLLEENTRYFNQIHANLANYQLNDNFSLFCKARDNILTILNEMNDLPVVMKQMPPLPVSMNEELLNSILVRPPMPSMPMHS